MFDPYEKTTNPVLSICIPTYNRSRYLNRLLPALISELKTFPHETEIIISDNCSTDQTQEFISKFSTELTLKYFRHESNFGAYANYMFALSKGCGQFLLYLADDDFINFPELDLAVKKLMTNPNLSAIYAPWILHNLVENKSQGQFYTQQNDILINKDNHLLLTETVLSLKLFPEIAVFRRVCWEKVAQTTPNLAYWAFVFSSLYVSAGDVLFSCRPFYVSITRYFHDDSRSQLGIEETENIWDVYRGGLEFMLSRAVRMINREKHLELLGLINDFIIQRMGVALRLKIANARSDIDIYYLACRLNGLGYNHLLPTAMDILSLRATLFFISTDHHQFKEPPKLLCHESLNDQDYDQIKLISRNRASRLLVNSEVKFCAIIFQSRNDFNEFYLNQIQKDHCRILIVNELRFKFPWF